MKNTVYYPDTVKHIQMTRKILSSGSERRRAASSLEHKSQSRIRNCWKISVRLLYRPARLLTTDYIQRIERILRHNRDILRPVCTLIRKIFLPKESTVLEFKRRQAIKTGIAIVIQPSIRDGSSLVPTKYVPVRE